MAFPSELPVGAGGDRGQEAPVLHSSPMPGVRHSSKGIGSPQTPSLVTSAPPARVSVPGYTREEVIAFGGIPDPISKGRRMSARILDVPEVDDM